MTRSLRVEVPEVPRRTTSTVRLRVYEGGHGEELDPPEVIGRVRRALVALREPMSIEHLENHIPGAVAMLGFERVVFARLRGSGWWPVSALPSTTGNAPAVVPAELDPASQEYRVVVEQAPVVVGPACAGRLLPAGWCRTYLVVPVVDRGAVIGLIHAGYQDPARTPSPLDREVLWMFAEALTPSVASARAGDALRDLVLRMSRVAGELGRPGPVADHAPPVDVSAREREVLELMAAGQTNSQIARRLVIAEGTAKSHVKRIMRKLNAANRAEAVAAWIRPAECAPPPVPPSRLGVGLAQSRPSTERT